MIDFNDVNPSPHPLAKAARLVTVDLDPHVETIASRFLGQPNPHHSSAKQWRWGTNGSLALELDGAERGKWFDHEHGEGGNDPWSLLTVHLRMSPEDARDALAELGIKPQAERSKKITATYDYHDAAGRLIFQVCRFEPKTFRQRRPDGKGGWVWSTKGLTLVPYRLPELLADIDARIFVVEGEKDVDRLRALGLVATTNPGGAGKWLPTYAQWLQGRDVVVLPDNDPQSIDKVTKAPRFHPDGRPVHSGRDHALEIAAAVGPVARILRVLELPGLPPKGDVSDWLTAGGTVDQLERLVNDCPIWDGARVEPPWSGPVPQDSPAPLSAAPGPQIGATGTQSDPLSTPLNGTVHPPGAPLAANWLPGGGQPAAATTPAAKRAPPDWTARLSLYENGEPRPTLDNCAIALEVDQTWRDVLWLDEFAQRIVARRPPPWIKPNGHWEPTTWGDNDALEACRWMQKAGLQVPTSVMREAVSLVSSRNKFHPVREYLEGLVWDGAPRLDRWLSTYLQAEDSAYARAVGSRWMISAVARIMRPGVKADHVLILHGMQGILKSAALRALTDPWFTDHMDDLGSKDSSMQTAGVWVIELAELDAMSRSEVKRIKAFISRTTERFRPPFGHYLVERPRQCVFAGSTNEDDFLRDPTGARRFWPVTTKVADVDALWRDRNQLWAEAVHRFKAGEPWYLVESELVDDAKVQQEKYREPDPWEETVINWSREHYGMMDITSSTILWHALGLQRQQWTRSEQMRVAAILKSNGWARTKQRRRSNVTVRCYEPPEVTERKNMVDENITT